MNPTSPLTGGQTRHCYDIPTRPIIDQWRQSDIDVSAVFRDLTSIGVYECLNTGYRFFYPLDLGGDDVFYRALQRFPWYYMDWKWEYDQALKRVKPEMRVLEIGCGQGDFIAAAKAKGSEVVGLEFNSAATEKCRAKRLTVFQESIESHAGKNRGRYDLVCSFQVMEHISEIGKALTASVEVLKPGGTLVISVPNNSSFIRHDPLNLLNTPPHHVGLWTEEALRRLPRFFPLEQTEIINEPLQPYHLKYFYQTMIGRHIDRIFGRWAAKFNILPRMLFLKLGYQEWFRGLIKGHTIMAAYKK